MRNVDHQRDSAFDNTSMTIDNNSKNFVEIEEEIFKIQNEKIKLQ
jgi:hypothetical protein